MEVNTNGNLLALSIDSKIINCDKIDIAKIANMKNGLNVENVGDVARMTKAKLLHHSPLALVAIAARTCTATVDKMDTDMYDTEFGPKDRKMISKRILKQGVKYDPMDPPHGTVLEHLVYTFQMEFSRGLLQEFKTHRIASSDVQSSRYTLKKLFKDYDEKDAKKYLVLTGDDHIDSVLKYQLSAIALAVCIEKPNDKIKYIIPDALKTKLIWTINARSLRNLFRLRTSKMALWEFRQLCRDIYDELPNGHRFIFKDVIHEEL